jgi:hypothetical protein
MIDVNEIIEILNTLKLQNELTFIDQIVDKANFIKLKKIFTLLLFSKTINEFIQVIYTTQHLDLVNLSKQSGLELDVVKNHQVIYPTKILTPFNIFDPQLQKICSIYYFSTDFRNNNVFIPFTYSEGGMDIDYITLKLILEIKGAKIREFAE